MTDGWVYISFCGIIKQEEMLDYSDIINDLLENVGLLNTILKNWLDQHIDKCIKDQTKHHNLALSWFRNNLSHFSAWVALNWYVIEDFVESVDSTTTLLRNPFSKIYRFIEVAESLGDVRECYLHYDQVKSK